MVNIFELVQKQTPYRVPEGFFENREAELKAAVRRKRLRNRWLYAAAAGVLLVGCVYGIGQYMTADENLSGGVAAEDTGVYGGNAGNADWSEFAEADIFLDNLP